MLSWDKLKPWLEEGEKAINHKNRLADEANQWLEAVRSKDTSKAHDELLRGSRLTEINGLREIGAFEKLGGLSQEEFINTSIKWQRQRDQQEKHRRRITVISLTVFSVVSSGLASFSVVQLNKANAAEQRRQDISENYIRSTWVSLNPSEQSPEKCGTWLRRGLRGLYCEIKPFVSYRQFIAISGLPIFNQGPHTDSDLNFEGGYEFGYYNPEFLKWVQEQVIFNPSDGEFKQQIQGK